MTGIKRRNKKTTDSSFEVDAKKQASRHLQSQIRENVFKVFIYFITILVILIVLFLIGFTIYNSVPLFRKFSFWKFLFTADWKPTQNRFGIGMITAMTLMLILLTMLFAVPLTLFTTIFLSEYLSRKAQKVVATFIQLLAGIPSIVFGIFARDQIGALFRLMGAPTNDNMMVAALTLAFMAIPTMVSLSYNAVKSVPQGDRLGSLALGVSKQRTSFGIVLRSSQTKVIAAIILGMSRVIGETMAVMMIAGNATGDFNVSSFGNFLFSSIRTLASTIGLEFQEAATPEHKAALFAIATFLFFLVFVINLTIIVISNVPRYRAEWYARRAERLHAQIVAKKIKPVNFSFVDKAKIVYSDPQLAEMVHLKTEDKFWKRTYDKAMDFFMVTSTAIVIAFTLWILGVIVVKGIIAFQFPHAFISIAGQDGIFAAFFVTILLIVATLIFAIPLSLAVAIYLNEYANPNAWTTRILRFILNLFASVPSIIFGIFGLQMFIVIFGLPFSVLAAALTMTLVILPMLITNFEDALSSVPDGWREAGAGLGMTRLQQIFKIVLPYAREGLITGIMLAMARIVGESAPVYLTLGTAIRMPAEGFLSSGATLTTAIYMLAAEAPPGPDQQIIYLLALITVLLVFALNFGSERISALFMPNRTAAPLSFPNWVKMRWHKFTDWYLNLSIDRFVLQVNTRFQQWKHWWHARVDDLNRALNWRHWRKVRRNWAKRVAKFNKIRRGESVE